MINSKDTKFAECSRRVGVVVVPQVSLCGRPRRIELGRVARAVPSGVEYGVSISALGKPQIIRHVSGNNSKDLLNMVGSTPRRPTRMGLPIGKTSNTATSSNY